MDNPFDSIESAREYIALLALEVEANAAVVREDLRAAVHEQAGRSVDALRLADFKLQELARHLAASRRILNDLRMLQRLLVGEGSPDPDPPSRAATAPSVSVRPQV